MKKSLLLSLSLAVAMSAAGQIAVTRSFDAPKASGAMKAAVITEQPEGMLVKYKRLGEGFYVVGDYCVPSQQDGRTSIVYAPDGETVYISGIFNGNNDLMGESWVKGSINADGTKITVPVGQSIYQSTSYNYEVLLAWGSTTIELDDSGNPVDINFTVDESVTEVTYTVDPETGVITLDGGEGNLYQEFPDYYNATGFGCYWSDDNTFASFLDWSLTLVPMVDAVPAVPADPVLPADAWFDSGEEDGYSCFDFYLPNTDVDGNEIDPELLSFTIFTDDDVPFVFDAATYSNDLTEDMTEIPYSVYYGGYDFDEARVYFYRTNTGDNPMFTRRIGIQVYYTVPVEIEANVAPRRAGTVIRNASNIVYYELPITAISNVEVDAQRASDNNVYNVMGMKMNADNLPAGIYVKNGKKFVVK